jgi:dTDP-4-amino-4,6-dideoxygalactose transaminase
VPQAIVIYDETSRLADYLRSNGIGAWCWPNKEMPKEIFEHVDQYPNTIHFNKSLVALPVHQGIDKKHIDYMVETLNKFVSND